MEQKRSMWTATLGIAAGLAALLVGITVRDQVDLGRRANQTSFTGPLLASRTFPDGAERVDLDETDYFANLTNLLKDEYVDPITDEQKLAVGAVRGMVTSLNDAQSLFFDKEHFPVRQAMREGRFEGIGVELVLVMPADKPAVTAQPSAAEGEQPISLPIPDVVVAAVVPGGPADRAGVQPGDVVDTVDSHWVLNRDLLDGFRRMQERVQKGQAKPDELRPLRRELRLKSESSIMPMRALELLQTGSEGAVKVIWRRGSETRETSITRAASKVEAVREEGGVHRVRFVSNVAEALKTLPATGSLKLDFRQNVNADLALLEDSLAALAPAGDYGTLKSRRKVGSAQTSVKVDTGFTGDRKLEIQVDSTTRGVAAAVAIALAEAGQATLDGKVGRDRTLTETVKLPDGSGFTLAKADWVPSEAK